MSLLLHWSISFLIRRRISILWLREGNVSMVDLSRLWAPWRIEYIRAVRGEGCIFCDKPRQDDDREMLILHRGRLAFVMMNLYPYNNGHLMIAPYDHVSDPTELPLETKTEIMDLADLAIKVLQKTVNPDGFNFGANFGKAAGAGIEEHIHYHLVPRWSGDTSFMPVLGHTKTVVEGLKETYDVLKAEFDQG